MKARKLWPYLLVASVIVMHSASAQAWTLGSNAVTQGDAEGGTTGWTSVSPNPLFATQSYGASGGWPTASDPGPANRGTKFFQGGSNATAEGHQVIDLSAVTALINAGQLSFAASAYLGGWSNQNDSASVTLRFKNSSGAVLATVSLPGPSAAGRNNVTGLFLVSQSGTVPANSTQADVDLKMIRAGGSANDGYADNLTVVFTQTGGGGSGGGSLNTNLIQNGDAEGASSAWIAANGGALGTQSYGASGYPTATDPGPAQRGSKFFYGASVAAADSRQLIDVSGLASEIASGLHFSLSAYLGGYATQDDRASIVAHFLAGDGSRLDTVVLGGPYAAERLGATGLFYSGVDGNVPAGTRSLDVHMLTYRVGGTVADGYIDNVSVVLHH